MSMSIKASPDGTYGEILVNGAVVAKLPVTGNAVIPGLVGTVGQSGGVPTGAIIERGSNANGEYVKYADGTMICSARITLTADGARYFATWTFPAAFIAAPNYTNVSGNITTAAWSTVADRPKLGMNGSYNVTEAYATLGIEEVAGQAITSGATISGCAVAAIGRWF